MLYPARLQTTMDALDRILRSEIPMDGTLGDYFRVRRFIGSKDRADIAERVYAVFRHYGRLTWHLNALGADIEGRSLVIAYLVLVDGKTTIDGFDGTKYHPRPLSQEEDGMVAALARTTLCPDAMPESLTVECPPEHEATLRALYGDAFADEMKAMLRPAGLDIRVNTVMAARERVQELMAKDRVRTHPGKYAPACLNVEGRVHLAVTRAFVKGFIDIQDQGSQMIAHVCDVKPGQQVLDYCAGAGGKTLALANAMQTKGRIVAMDLEAGRLEKARPRFRRAHVHDNIEVRPLSDERHRKWLRRQKGTFDVVLLDVPCSGSGTWRRNPDTRWRRFGPDLAELTTTQRDILTRVAETVKPGGRLVYATCSLLPQENEEQIAWFLKERPDYTVLPLPRAWPEGTPCPVEGDFMRLTPRRHSTDGFFAAVLVRQAGQADQTLSGV